MTATADHRKTPPHPAPAPPLIAIRGVDVRRGGRAILREVDLEVHRREIVTIIGPNGAGKSTLLQAVLGLIPVDSGTVERAANLTIGYVPQRLRIAETMPLPVADFIHLSKPGRDGHPAFPETPELLARLGCDTLLDHPMDALSGGEMQRVLLARALVRRPNLLVLDEPAQGMDVAGERDLHQFLEALRSEWWMGVLLVSHDLHFVMATTDRVVCLNRHVCCSGTPSAVCVDPEFLSLFGEQVSGFGIYQHRHDHAHHRHAPPITRPGGEQA